jgi:hypothetical protein
MVGPLKVCIFPGHRPRNVILRRSRYPPPPNTVDREIVLNEIFNFFSTKLTEGKLEAAMSASERCFWCRKCVEGTTLCTHRTLQI